MSDSDLLACSEELPSSSDNEEEDDDDLQQPHFTPGSRVMDVEYASPSHKPQDNKTLKKLSSKKSTTTTKKKSIKKNDDKDDTKSPASTTTASSSKPKKTFVQMAHDAIVALGDRTGSSQIAIAKYMLSEYSLEDGKPFRSRLNLALKTAVKHKRFKKIRASYKIEPAYTKKERDKKRKLQKKSAHEKLKDEKEQKRLAELKQAELEKNMSPEELQALRDKQQQQQEAARKKQEAARLAKERAERIRRRRFPMEDTKLHLEDKELGVKPPEDVARRPYLPYLFQATLPLEDPKRKGKTPGTILTASKCDHLEYGSRGLGTDLLAVYHFFRGDVHYTGDEPLVPDFTVKHLMYAVDEVLNGNAKRSRMVPPLISHLFVTCLKLLTMTTTSPAKDETANEKRLREDLSKLAAGLSPASWGEVCALYMDTMERYYTSNASVDPNVLPSGVIDIRYLMRSTDTAEPMTPAVAKKTDDDVTANAVLPDGYCAYLGNPHSTLARGHGKLLKQDPWNLTAEELMALLRALTDDILASKPEIGEDLAKRDVEMYELLKAKRAADSHFRKIRLAFEGPKQSSRSKGGEKKKESDSAEKDAEKDSEEPKERKQLDEGGCDNKENSTDEADDKKEDEAPKFKPTVTRKQFESAVKAQHRAHDAYEKGLRTLTSRTEPVGYDRNHNAVYFFNHDPDMLYVEVSKPPAATVTHLPSDMLMKRYSWHVIETKSLFDAFETSLDIRGTRENDLYEALLGPVGGHYSLRRGLFDDLKIESDKTARVREREDLERRLANARIACQAEEDGGRRSGRLQSRAQIDLCQVEEEIENLEKRIAADAIPVVPDYEELTGLDLLRKFDAVGRRETRSTRERKAASEAAQSPAMPCTKLIPSGNIDGSGIVGSVVSELLKIEEACEALTPWERDGMSRDRWIAELEERVHAWNSTSEVIIGPQARDADDLNEVGSLAGGTPLSKSKHQSIGGADSSDSKRRKLEHESPSSTGSMVNASPSQILASLKSPLLDLEERVFEITGLATATQDADEADDNMSASSEDQRSLQEQKEKLAWKKKINALRYIETKRHSQIREVVVEAITAARKAQQGSVVSKLRSALLLHHPNAASECKVAALAVLDNHGGYHEEDDDSDDESVMDDENNEEEDEIPSLLCGEAMMITGSLGGDDNADRVDWIDAVKSCKTISRWAALAFAFTSKATEMLEKIEGENETLWQSLRTWEKEEQRLARSRNGKPKPAVKKQKEEEESPTEVWANVRVTRDFCMAKINPYPAWPAKRCEPKDKELAASLKAVGRVLVSLIGEDGGLRVVKLEDIRPFDGKVDNEDLSDQPKAIRSQLDECMVMARRIVRGRKHGKVGKETTYVEEKKSAM